MIKKNALIFVGIAAVAAVITLLIISLKTCDGNTSSNASKAGGINMITVEEAKKMMSRDDGHVIVDVRSYNEYESGHIPGAICIPNETIENKELNELPDLEQIILVYCRSGRRSKEAALKLWNIGYKNVYEFGGILDWDGEIIMDISNGKNRVEPKAVLLIEANGKRFYATLENNSSAEALKNQSVPFTVKMHDYGNFEKVGKLPFELPANDEQITTKPGDVILYQGDQITIYYGENTWSFTKLATINNVTKEELLSALGEGDVTVEFSLEWEE